MFNLTSKNCVQKCYIFTTWEVAAKNGPFGGITWDLG